MERDGYKNGSQYGWLVMVGCATSMRVCLCWLEKDSLKVQTLISLN